MKKLILIALVGLTLGCSAPKKIVNSAPSFYSFTTNKPFSEAWDKIIDYVTTKGVSIKTIEKASGIIVTDDYSLLNSYTYEDKNGKLVDPDAFVVINRIKSALGKTLKPEFITGNYNIRAKQSDSVVTVTVNLVNLKGGLTVDKNMYGRGGYLVYYKIKSTNVFEKMLAERLQ